MATFKTRARALDMLGRQQIAGIPTAISELFKNAHDAYANRAEVDFYKSTRMFVLRDDGFGMTQDDFEGRWLTLATESKVANHVGTVAPSVPSGSLLRPILGEKGIGRLSIGVIGPQVLILSRARRGDSYSPLIAAYVNWRIFEMPGINLEDIVIPVRCFDEPNFPSRQDLQYLTDEFKKNLINLPNSASDGLLAEIEDDITSFNFDPRTYDNYVEHLSLQKIVSGTQFYILPSYETILGDLEESKGNDGVAPLVKFLIGFANTMTPNHLTPRITTAFRVHDVVVGTPQDIVAEGEFWTPEEFESADHHFSGHFDEYGQFRGTVTVYGQQPVEQVVPWLKAVGRPTECGPFTINLAYVHGVLRDTKVPPLKWGEMFAKGNRIGGLYIYRDGIRVLPYGSYDYDWLDIERNRSKSAIYYFFSYRRMFGVIEISKEFNSNLSEKAGREGFRENKAYRQMRDILQTWLEYMVANFFRPGGTYTDVFEEEKKELQRSFIAKERRDKLVRERTRHFVRNLDELFNLVDQMIPENRSQEVLQEVSQRLTVASTISNSETAALILLDAESNARKRIAELSDEFRLAKPRGIGLSKEASRKWSQYQREFSRLEEEVFSQVIKQIDETVGQAAQTSMFSVDRRRRIERALLDLTAQTTRTVREERKLVDSAVVDVKDKVIRITRDMIKDVQQTAAQVLTRFAETDFSNLDDNQMVVERIQLEDIIVETADRSRDVLESIREQLNSINLIPGPDGRITGSVDETEELEQRLISMEERQFEDLELLQLGSALQIVNHEFRGAVLGIRRNLNRMKAWADINKDLGVLYDGLRTSFEHLDNYLTLFTPLQRRLYRSKTEISGANIGDFIEKLFADRLRRHGITLVQSSQFRQFSVHSYASSFLPVFVNLVDNSMYWLSTIRDQPQWKPTIVLGSDSMGFIVSDNGPGIAFRDMEQVFLAGHTLKPGGQGLGLYVARQTLREQGFDLFLEKPTLNQGATFHIVPQVTGEEGTEQ